MIDKTKNNSDEEIDSDDITEEPETSKNVDWNFSWANRINKELKKNEQKLRKAYLLSKKKQINESGEKEKEPLEEKPEIKFKVIKGKTDLRIKPSIKDINRQKTLKKIASKGVVQFFNAVGSQQNFIEEKVKNVKSIDKKEDVILKNMDKNKFLDVLLRKD